MGLSYGTWAERGVTPPPISTITHSPVCNIPSPYPPEEEEHDKAPIAETILPSSCLSMDASASFGKSV
ncbi:hypothetical protein FPOA_04320 [Fusarium poae]|uniref:Uncharacterized protein n=1 Tax=Fusarium poae TaxID=36050 RepID=A0A1B8ATA8_FUSPO|nr:hypothetical protein FPOA_04320 [Fusarium poae]